MSQKPFLVRKSIQDWLNLAKLHLKFPKTKNVSWSDESRILWEMNIMRTECLHLKASLHICCNTNHNRRSFNNNKNEDTFKNCYYNFLCLQNMFFIKKKIFLLICLILLYVCHSHLLGGRKADIMTFILNAVKNTKLHLFSNEKTTEADEGQGNVSSARVNGPSPSWFSQM